ncbi:MAG: butyrate kinase [Desulfitobacteriia bacterium]
MFQGSSSLWWWESCVNNIMVDFLKTRPRADHASNIAALIAYELAEEVGIPAYIYDAISVNELSELAQISGLPHIRRCGISHVLNQRAMTRKYAQTQNRDYADLTLIIAHLGGGITMSVHHRGKIIDVLFDDEGPFTPERAGKLPCAPLIEMCYSEQCDYQTALKLLRGQGGLVAYLGTNNTLEVEKRIAQGDQQALLIYQAMAYQIAKGIGELATVVNGQVDAIILTGGIAHSQLLTGWIADRVKFIAKVVVMPGENELEALALGVLRVLRGEEEAHEFQIEETDLNS